MDELFNNLQRDSSDDFMSPVRGKDYCNLADHVL